MIHSIQCPFGVLFERVHIEPKSPLSIMKPTLPEATNILLCQLRKVS